jgi:hypothetical protein
MRVWRPPSGVAVTEFSHVGFRRDRPSPIRTWDGHVCVIVGVGTMLRRANAGLFRTRKVQSREVLDVKPNGMRQVIPVSG